MRESRIVQGIHRLLKLMSKQRALVNASAERVLAFYSVLQGLKVRGVGEASVEKDSVSAVTCASSSRPFYSVLGEGRVWNSRGWHRLTSFLASFDMFDLEAH